MGNLLEALDCENEDIVIDAFMERYRVTKEEAQDIFTETKKWLWLAACNRERNLIIDNSLLIIDEMWHNFLLHSKLYYEYCIKKLKKLVHHVPTTDKEKRQFKEEVKHNPTVALAQEKTIKNQYSLIYDQLGAKTLVKWYDTFANKYTPEYIESIKKY